MNIIYYETMKFMTKIGKNKTAQGTGTDVQQLLQFPPSLLFGLTWPIAKQWKFLLHI